MKWKEYAWPIILKRHFQLTKEAVKENPDLIVWPETAFPGIVNQDKKLLEEVKLLAKEIHTPLLFGAVVKEGDEYYNSALLFRADGSLAGQYKKMHLVPFGEYFPLRSILSPLANWLGIEDFNRGTEYKVFTLNESQRFSALICFEDTVTKMGRKFAQNGASLFINVTNDAWFKESKASSMHFQSSVFRTIENRKGLVRCANTGVSNFIDPTGRIMATVHNQEGKSTNVDGWALAEMPLNDTHTFYMKYGNLFAYFCFGCILWMFFSEKRNPRSL
jgi:apolipoprotein N-acyltransferase